MAEYPARRTFREYQGQINDRCMAVGLFEYFHQILKKCEDAYPNYSQAKLWETAFGKIEEEVVRREQRLVAGSASSQLTEQGATIQPDSALREGGANTAAPPDLSLPPLVEDSIKFVDESKIDVMTSATWVFHNLGKPEKKINYSTAPSSTAKVWLRHLSDPENTKSLDAFFNTWLLKMAPKDTGEKEESALRDDGRQILGILERLKKKT